MGGSHRVAEKNGSERYPGWMPSSGRDFHDALDRYWGAFDHPEATEVPTELKVAVTDRVSVIDTTQAPEPVQAPDHPENVEPVPALAVKVTDVPDV
jgi:hypothetical protein